MHLKCERFASGMGAGEYGVSGTVLSFSTEENASALVLDNISLNGLSVDGKLSVSVPTEEVRTGDIVSFTAHVTHSVLPTNGDSFRENLFIKDIRYLATVSEEGIEITGRGNALLHLNGKVYDLLHSCLAKTQADTAYALLTGNAGNMDEGFATSVRQGGVAHIFAVSGLHIGILYAGFVFLSR
ncbi:MAG: ComEC/Rec2 family competence protein, partial [Clostridia bacterium]|nr:ComEC/Rec2 family competence protein [Clostridia bacterium]